MILIKAPFMSHRVRVLVLCLLAQYWEDHSEQSHINTTCAFADVASKTSAVKRSIKEGVALIKEIIDK